MMHEIPRDLADITAGWLTAALRSTGVLRDGRVVSCRVEPVGQEFGFASRVARIEATYDPPERGGPASLIAKLAASSDDALRSQTLREKNRREVNFYRDFAPLVGIRVPHCHYVAGTPDGTGFVLLLEDLGRGRFGDVGAGWRLADAELVIDALARLHARWWEDPRLAGRDWLPRYATDSAGQLSRLVERRGTFLSRHGAAVAREIEELTGRLGSGHASLLDRLQGPPQTLLHVDAHLDNVAFVPDETGKQQAVLFDWQGTASGLCVVDLALFVNGTTPERRRQHEPGLLERYHARLVSGGVEDYAFDRLLADYRIAMLRWWIGTVNGLGSDYAASWTGRQIEVARQGVERWNAAAVEHRLWELA